MPCVLVKLTGTVGAFSGFDARELGLEKGLGLPAFIAEAMPSWRRGV